MKMSVMSNLELHMRFASKNLTKKHRHTHVRMWEKICIKKRHKLHLQKLNLVGQRNPEKEMNSICAYYTRCKRQKRKNPSKGGGGGSGGGSGGR